MNHAAAALFHTPRPEDLLGRDYFSLLPEDLSKERLSRFEQALVSGQSLCFEDEWVDRVFENTLAPTRGEEDLVVALALFSKDVTDFRRTDEELRREQQRLIFLMESLPGFLALIDANHAIHYANRYFRKRFGRIRGKTCQDLMRSRLCECDKRLPKQTLADDEPREWEWTDDQGQTYQVYSHPMTDGSLKVIVHGIDISAQKRAQTELARARDELELRVEQRTVELRESEARFRAVVEDQGELICRMTTDRVIYFVNGAYCRFFGARAQDLIGTRFLEQAVEEDRPVVEGLFDPMTPHETTRTVELRAALSPTDIRWLRWNIRAILDKQGRVLEHQAVGMDVTRRRLAEQRYYRLIQNLPVIIFALSYDFQLVFINETCRTLLGYEPEEALSQRDWFFERIHPEDRESVRRAMFSAPLTEGETPAVEFRFEHRKGYLVNLLARPAPHSRTPSSGEFDQVEGMIMDVTERTFLDKILVQREKLNTLGAMSDELAHEIRNPLFALAGFARLLRRKHPELEEAEVILQEAERLEKLLDRIRRYLEPVDVTRQPCRVGVILTFSIDMMAGPLARRSIRCDLETDPRIGPVRSDPDILSQVFVNLINNSMAVMAAGGSIHVSVYETLRHVAVDFAIGPVAKTLSDGDRLLMPFDAEKESFNLAVCYRLLKNVDGYLTFKQNGERASFSVLLPKELDLSRLGGSDTRPPA